MTEPRIPLARPDLSEDDVAEVAAVLRTPWLSMGPKVLEFETRFAAFVGVPHAVAVANGTCGLHLALRAVGVRPGTEVVTTPFSFVATANAILYEQARPVFVDVDPLTLNLTPDGVRALLAREYVRRDGGWVRRSTGGHLAALLPVATFGHPVEMDPLRALAREYGLPLVHDTCEAFGSLYRSSAGTWISEAARADAAVYAFYPNKQITTGEGGMVVTDDAAIAEACRTMRNQGRRVGSEWLAHEVLGYNYRLDEMSAALGVAQLRRAPELLGRRARVAQWYEEALAPLEMERPRAAPWARPSWFVYVVRIPAGINRDAVIARLGERGIAAKPYFPPIHLFPHLRDLGYRPGDFPVAEGAAARTVALPFYTTLTREQVGEVVAGLQEAILSHVEV